MSVMEGRNKHKKIHRVVNNTDMTNPPTIKNHKENMQESHIR